MASKIKGQTMYLPIKPYTLSEGTGEEFNELAVGTRYDDRNKHFYVSIHAGWSTGFGHGCVIMGDNNPLSAPQYVKVKDAPKNSQKYLDQMYANLEAGKEAIAWLFDHREWQKLNAAVCNMALYGYTEQFRKQMEELINSINNIDNRNSEDKVMTTKKNNNESKNVQNNTQVNNETIDVNVGEVTVDSIMPVMQPVEGTEYGVQSDGKTATFESMAPNIGSEHAEEKPKANTGRTKFVVARVPKPGEEGAVKSEKSAAAQTSSISPQTSPLPMVRLVVYTTKRREQAPRIEGFGGENDPRWKRHYDDKVRLAKEKKEADAFNEKLQAQMKGKPKAEREKLRKQWKSVGSDPFGASYFTDRTTGDKYYQMTMGAKYMDVARELVDAYNSGDEQAIAAAEQAVIDCKNGIVKDIEAEKAAKRAEREAKKSLSTDPSPKGEGSMSDEEQAMFALFKKFMAGDKDAMAKVGAVLKQAA